MSIHGICFDEGQSGSCGLDCRGFQDGECSIAEEMLEMSMEADREELIEYAEFFDLYGLYDKIIFWGMMRKDYDYCGFNGIGSKV